MRSILIIFLIIIFILLYYGGLREFFIDIIESIQVFRKSFIKSHKQISDKEKDNLKEKKEE